MTSSEKDYCLTALDCRLDRSAPACPHVAFLSPSKRRDAKVRVRGCIRQKLTFVRQAVREAIIPSKMVERVPAHMGWGTHGRDEISYTYSGSISPFEEG